MTMQTLTRRGLRIVACCLGLAVGVKAGADVLPDERADASWRVYEGGGITVQGPSMLVRTNVNDKVSLTGGYQVDQVTGASIDMVVLGASPMHEVRKQKNLGVDYLYGNTTYSVGFSNSIENDYDDTTVNAGISQTMFGDLTTVTLSVSRGWDIITRVINSDGEKDPGFRKRSDRRTWGVSLSQILTRDFIAGLDYEAITEQGYLQNPYRAYRYLAAPGANLFLTAPEIYPTTHTSNAAALRLKYYLPWHAALTAKYRYSFDTWDIHSQTGEISYTQPMVHDTLTADLTYRHYRQNSASFYSDLFQYANQFTYMARDRELASQYNNTMGAGLTYDVMKSRHWFMKKATVSMHVDYISYHYLDFRDAALHQYAAGTEPLYHYNATVSQLAGTIWF